MGMTEQAEPRSFPWASKLLRRAAVPARNARAGVPTMRVRLAVFAIACTGVALAALATLLLVHVAEDRADDERDIEKQAITIKQSIEAKVAVTEAVLVGLATSPMLQSGDLHAFYDQAKALVPTYGSRILLYERDEAGVRHALLNTRLPFGAPQPTLRDTQSSHLFDNFLADIAAGRAPQVSDVLISSLDGQRITAIGIPVIWDGKVHYVLVGVLPAMDNAPIFGPSGLPPRWSSAVADRNGVYVAGHDTPDRAANLPVLDAAFRAAVTAGETVFGAHSEDGKPLHVAVSRSDRTGWLSIVAVPEQIFDAPWHQALLIFGTAAGVLLLATFGFGWLAEPRIALPLRRRLIEDEERFRTMANTVPSILFTTDTEGRCDYASDAFYACTGMPAGSAKGLGWVDAIHPSDRQRVFETLALPITAPSRSEGETPTGTHSGQPGSNFIQPTDTEIRLRTKDGNHRWFLIRARVVSDASGRPVKRFGTATDIDDLKQAERALRQRMSELAHMNRRTLASELSAAIAHELNQPLGAILSNTETAEVILNSPSPSVNDIREILTDIKRDDQRASEVIRRLRRLLTNSGVEAQDVDLNDIVREAIELLSAQASERNVTLDHALTPQALQISGDRIQLQQVILNLIVNGIEAAERTAYGIRKVVLTSTAVLGGTSADLSVGDSGGGVGAGEQERVFEPFFTTKEHGMGMGLSIARTIVEAHGGRIWAENQTQGGALFRITLPLTKVH